MMNRRKISSIPFSETCKLRSSGLKVLNDTYEKDRRVLGME